MTRAHEPEMLRFVAELHADTPIMQLSAEGVQARSWEALCRASVNADWSSAFHAAGITAIAGHYAVLFDLDPVQVAEDLPRPKMKQ